ncbi:hypothetical protein T265_02289 [Opisthorchis viverrini]|uniref:Uncharacterized protein n=1 Tax=Opisthorchis viverrini TaxID=6198 RepID=A0A074ZZS9_OPIVI|nr:hypothetical protein T265_02289 [Opisthorchis viverrini]KER31522.1 hypothetical protein T265_02289 [Opisthorchis viverrini]
MVRMIPGVCSNFNAKASTESVFHPSVILRSFYESHNGGSYVALSYHIKTNRFFSTFKHVPMKCTYFHLQVTTRFALRGQNCTGQNNSVQTEQPIWKQKSDVVGPAICRCTWTSDMIGTLRRDPYHAD